MSNSKFDNNNYGSDSESRVPPRPKKRGERIDGYRVRDVKPFHELLPFLMKTRDSSSNFFKMTYDISNVIEYLDEKNKNLELENNENNSIKKYGFNLFFIAALTRVIALRPHLNRFISGKRIYQRHDIEIGYVIKKNFNDDGEESSTVSPFLRDSNIEDVKEVLDKSIFNVKKETDDGTGDFIKTLMKFPTFMVTIVIALFDLFAFIGHGPKVLKDIDTMQASAFIANLGSIGLEKVPYHHLYDRGTCSMFLTLGRARKELVSTKEGFVEKNLVDVAITMDERITDGFYFVKSLDLLQDILNNPYLLDKRLKEVPIDK
ncbi:hypothetical protein [Methanobrevibacter filiformis]|uniref:2-oxoacid dehydrogenases acyltransferase n=1 Tax=Methanobrevibacter filiformis TaxID=55758 RepID=A0A165YY74_9EURY|nr:hypothetical protein [Methanobrevibacter filiformis]KZX10014.1 2-oxoacid dehydrogenases acyltransferase [Methanobrevibacter filiformis]